MVDSLWFVLALVLLAVVSVALVLVLVLQREEAHGGRETRTEYLQPNYGQTGGFRVSSAPSNETIIPYRYWLIEGQVSEIEVDFDEPGQYTLVCHEYCGIGHHTMFMTINVE